MVEGIPIGVANLSAVGLLFFLVALLVMALVKGWLIPRAHYDTIVGLFNAQKVTTDRLLEINATQSQTMERQLAVGDAVEKIVDAIQDNAKTGGGTS